MSYFQNLSTERILKIHVGWRIIGLILYWIGFPYDTAGFIGQGAGILLGAFVLINYEDNNFYAKWIWYIFTAFSSGVFYLYLTSEKVGYFYIVTLPVFLTQLISVYKIYEEDKYS